MRINLSHTEINIWNYENNRHQNIKHSKEHFLQDTDISASSQVFTDTQVMIRTVTHRVCDEEKKKKLFIQHVSVVGCLL